MSAQAPRVSGEAQMQRLPMEPGAAESCLMTRPTVAASREGEAVTVGGGPQQRPLAARRAAGALRACPLPPPLGHTLDRTGGRVGGLVEQLAALAQGTRLAPVGQETHRAHARQALGHKRQAQAADARRRLQGHGLPAVALASVAGGKAPRAVLPSDAAVGGEGHAVRGAAESVPPRPRASPGLRGVDAPRLARKLVDASPEALRSREGLGRLRHPHRPHGRAGEEGITALATADRAQGVDGQKTRGGVGTPRVPCSPRAPPGPRPCPWQWAPRV